MCGGTIKTWSQLVSIYGLSPRVRGNRWLPEAAHVGHGSIPACAGEPPPGSSGIALNTVYPRVCGGTGSRPGRYLF